MAVYKESLVAVCIRLTIFYWLILTIVAIGRDPGLMLDVGTFIDALHSRIWYTVASCIVAIALVGMGVFLLKTKRQFVDLGSRSMLGLTTTMGPIPTPTNALPRIKNTSARLPILDARLGAWLLQQNVPVVEIIPNSALKRSRVNTKELANLHTVRRAELDTLARSHPRTAALASDAPKDVQRKEITAHGKLFLAVWDTYCAHKRYPASHREGGHGSVRLHDHCLSVAARCLIEISPDGGNWRFEGVFVKRRGRNPVKMFENVTGYQPHPNDPLIPLIGLAHDLGKLEAYEVDRKGKIRKNKEPLGNTLADDDAGVIHDVLGPRILTRMPEFWELQPQDRAVLNTAVAHYHHPSKIPLNSHYMINDPRAASLMMLMIIADRAVSALEAGIDTEEKRSQELTEEATAAIYETFVQIVTTHGRINGVGKQEEDAKIRIGQKHENFIAIKMGALLALMRKELGISLESGEGKHDLTNQLLAILKEKGLLYTKHNGVDFGLYNPLYRVGLYHHTQTRHFGDIAPALLIHVPSVEMEEFYALTHLALNPCHVIVKNLILSHIPKDKIKDKANLDALVEQAFGAEEAKTDLHAEVVEDQMKPMVAPASAISTVAGDAEALQSDTGDGAGAQEAASSAAPENAVAVDDEQPVATEQPAPPREVMKAVGKLKESTLEDAARLIEKRRSGKGATRSKSESVAEFSTDDVLSAVPDMDLMDAAVSPRQAQPKRTRALATDGKTQAKKQSDTPKDAGPRAPETGTPAAITTATISDVLDGHDLSDEIGGGASADSAEAPKENSPDHEATGESSQPIDEGVVNDSDVLSEDEWNRLNTGYVDDTGIDAGAPEVQDDEGDLQAPEAVDLHPNDEGDLEAPDGVDQLLDSTAQMQSPVSVPPVTVEPDDEPDLSDEIIGDSIPSARRKPQRRTAPSRNVVIKRGGDTF
jgi:hypothetical protein